MSLSSYICPKCSHRNESRQCFCEKCRSLLPRYFFRHYEKNHPLIERFVDGYKKSFQEGMVERTFVRTMYQTEWTFQTRHKIADWKIPSAVEVHFENNRKYSCPNCKQTKDYANPCPNCFFPLTMVQSTSLKVRIQEIWEEEVTIGFQGLFDPRLDYTYRNIATVGDISFILEGAQAGLIPVVIPRQQHPSLYIVSHYYQHIDSKEVRLFNNTHVEAGFFPLFDIQHYPYTYQSRVGAYMVPKDIHIGEVVWLEDIIEDFIGNVRFFAKRLRSAPAIWDGERFVILYSRKYDVQLQTSE